MKKQFPRMKKPTGVEIRAHIIHGASYLLLLIAATAMGFFSSQAPTNVSPRPLTFAERVSYQGAIEEVYWRHRIWPKDNPNFKPSLDAVISEAQIEKKVEDYLRESAAVETYSKGPITGEQLQAEMDRMARKTRQPDVLRELFEALGNDPSVIAECLARPVLAERLSSELHLKQMKTGPLRAKLIAAATGRYRLPQVSDDENGCIDDTWSATSITDAPDPRQSQTAVWTGSEMIIWGGIDATSDFNTGGRYFPSTDSWTRTSTVNAPHARSFHSAVWTGTEMIVWGGEHCCPLVHPNTGGRYNPSTDNWVATTATGAPRGRSLETAVWTGTEMIVWGGINNSPLDTGGRYNPKTDTWTDISTSDAPSARYDQTAVWTGSAMIVWGGTDGTGINYFNTGGRYNPNSDTWTATTTTNAPGSRAGQTAVWTGAEMIVWGGANLSGDLNTGGSYNPTTDNWTPTSTSDAPRARDSHAAIWTGSEMVVWGGFGMNNLRTGGRYNPTADSWLATTTTDAPAGRVGFTAVWTGDEMILWGGFSADQSDFAIFNTGGRYCAASSPTPTPTPTPTPEPLELRAQQNRVRGINTVRLNWRGATSSNIDIYRNDVLIATEPSDARQYIDSTGETGQAQYTYMVCEANTQACSNQVVVTFPQ